MAFIRNAIKRGFSHGTLTSPKAQVYSKSALVSTSVLSDRYDITVGLLGREVPGGTRAEVEAVEAVEGM